MSDQQADSGRLYSLSEAAQLTGLSVNALRHRIKRRKLQAIRGNDGMLHVRLDNAAIEALKASQASEDAASRLHSEPGSQLSSQLAEQSRTITALQDHVTTLQEGLAKAGRERDEARALADQRGDELRQQGERLGRAEGEAKALRDALAEARRPAWRRWLGLS